jgi:myosin-5
MAILHLGQFTYSGDRKNQFSVQEADHLAAVVANLGIEAAPFQEILCKQKIVSGRTVNGRPETIVMPRTEEQCVSTRSSALTSRDTIAMMLYQRLFAWLVQRINQTISHEQASSTIGILDIYGFETFETNSFEQFCINYANEKLQCHFNNHLFKVEQVS